MIVIAAEKNFESRVRKFLNDNDCYEVKFFANAYTKSGIPDILCCCNGYFLAIEVKAPNGRPSELQKWNIRKILEAYGIGVILYPDQFDDFQEVVGLLNIGKSLEAMKIVNRINERWCK